MSIATAFTLWAWVFCAAHAENLLVNGGFDEGLAHWSVSPQLIAEPAAVGSRPVARLVVSPDQPIGWPSLSQEFPASPGDVFELRASVLAKGLTGGYGAYLACEFLGADGNRITFAQTPPAEEETWSPLITRTMAPPGAARVCVRLLVNGHGEALFDDAELIRLPGFGMEPLDGPVTLTVSDEIVCEDILGFGAEDDGWFYNPENAARGVTESDYALREARIAWMDADYVRMFSWYKDWNPSGDWATFTFDSPNMQSHYRTLDLYQKIGARVNVTGVEWGVDKPFDDPAGLAHATGELFDHLIRVKGYSCVQDWTLTNEPNGFFANTGTPFERYVEIHARVKRQFEQRGLRVRIVGSDDTGGLPWFTRCVEMDAYFDLVDYFASHRYFPFQDRVFAPQFFEDRLSLLAARQPRKPFVVAEFGFQDSRSSHLLNPIMQEYPYAVWTAAFIIEGLNRGVAGFSIWCLHEVYYPGNGFMNYGLWDFKGNDWDPRPVYHAFSMFPRLTEAGDPARRCVSSHPNRLKGAFAGDTLFWVNEGAEPATVRIEGVRPSRVRVMTESTIEGDRECGVLLELAEPVFDAPPMSFGYVETGVRRP